MDDWTLGRLTEELNKFLAERPDLADRVVRMEGCDCDGPVQSIVADMRWDPFIVMLGRDETLLRAARG